MEVNFKLNKDFEKTLKVIDEKYGEDFEILNGFHESQLNFSDFINGFVHIIVDDVVDVNDPLYKLTTNHIEELRDESMYVSSTFGESIKFILEVKWKKPL